MWSRQSILFIKNIENCSMLSHLMVTKRKLLITYEKLAGYLADQANKISNEQTNIYIYIYIYHQVGRHWTIFNVFSKWLQYNKLKSLHYSLFFLNAKTTSSLRMRFCQLNTTKVVQSCPSIWCDLKQKEIS